MRRPLGRLTNPPMQRVRREKEEVFSGLRGPPGKGSLQPVAVEAAAEVTKPSEPSTQRPPSGRPASVQAVTQVNSRPGPEMGHAGAECDPLPGKAATGGWTSD